VIWAVSVDLLFELYVLSKADRFYGSMMRCVSCVNRRHFG
jgi:hypothetical protein